MNASIFIEKCLADKENTLPLPRNKQAGCSSARLEYASGGRVVAGSNPVTPTGKKKKAGIV